MPEVAPARPPAARRGAPTPALLGLLAVTAAWGSTFFLLKDVLTRIPVADFLAVRFALAAAAGWVIAPRATGRLPPAVRRHGVVLGLVFGAAQLLQTVGLRTTSASVSGFVTGMCVVFTPLIAALVLRARLGPRVWAAVALATAGLAVLSLRGFAVGAGEALTLAAAVLYGAHIVGLGLWSRGRDALGLTVVQLTTVALVCLAGALPGGVVLPARTGDWLAVAYMALVVGALALVVQTWAQAQLSATRAAIVMTMEPVFAAGFAVLLGGESLGPRVAFGGLLVLVAMYVVELAPGAGGRAPVADAAGGATHVGPV